MVIWTQYNCASFSWTVTPLWIHPRTEKLEPVRYERLLCNCYLNGHTSMNLSTESNVKTTPTGRCYFAAFIWLVLHNIIDFHQGAKRPKRLSFEWSHIEYFIHGLKFRTKPFKKFYFVAFVWLIIFIGMHPQNRLLSFQFSRI